MKKEIVPSLIAKDQNELNKIYNKIKGAKTIQLDVMDGKYVKNRSLWFDFKLPNHMYEAHLMTTRPEMFIGRHHDSIRTFIVHVETVSDVDSLISFVHSMKKRLYLALNTDVPVSKIKKYLKKIDGVLVMTVTPGRYGARFMPAMAKKIQEIRRLDRKIIIEVDGSVNEKTISLLKDADRFSVGSYLQKSKDIKKAISSLQTILR